MKENVLVVHNLYRYAGGEANVAENEIAMLRAHGHAVTTYFRENTQLDGAGLFRKLLLPFTSIFSWKTYREIKAVIREKQIDVVQVHNTVPLVSPSVYYAAWAMGVPVVQTVHNFRLLCPDGVFFRDGHICEECREHSLLRAVRHGCYRHSRAQSLVMALTMGIHRLLGTYRRIEAYICLTEFNKNKLTSLVPADRIYLKPNVLTEQAEPLPLKARKRQFCCVGRLDKEKGVYTLLEAFRTLPEETLVIAGNGPEEAGMKAFLAKHFMKNVVMAGQVDNLAARRLIAESYAMVLPTKMYEGFPMTLLESLCAGTPVIGTDIGNVAACLRETGAGPYFDRESPAALAEQVRALDERAWNAYHENAIRAAKAMPDGEENYRMLVAIYQKAIARRKGTEVPA